MMITVVFWKWGNRYSAEHVNRGRSMVSRHLRLQHEVVCVTDDPSGIDGDIRIVPIADEMGYATHPRRPNCYRRLTAFAPDAADWLGRRILSFDLDIVITDDITDKIDRDEDFVALQDRASNTPYNGSMWLLTAGSRPQVWESFDPETTPELTRRMGIVGSDQAQIARALGPNEAVWTEADGFYAYGRDICRKNGGKLPANAKAVFFFGPHDPATSDKPWVKEHWR